MRDYMLLIMVYTVYHDAFVGGAVACDLIGQLFEFNVYYTYKLISNFQIFYMFYIVIATKL